MLLFVGLGNPGAQYAYHRHNVGFMALDDIVERHSFSPWKLKFQGRLADGRIGTERVLALEPTTYMNDSGRSVGEAMRFFKLTPADVVVFHDELDLAAGKVRVKKGGGTAGHNGLRSLDAHIGPEFWRVRIGIGHPGHKDRVHGWVLGDFAKADEAWLDPLLEAMAKAAPLLAERAPEKFMTQVAQATQAA
ncbi:aminoacyl-tRNA hydrolase [Inquilinus limosus]|uniref:Peptidyl-tRNA hydrolase n=1 Tax=Inquilinus limosus TaxID=171674 RepID=A0A211YZ59_9PROT|nr:aminoacyl-tRNA hydrolase [Inquilinus limosus]OWJ58308.1 aminoacyl-tRNA hydrolase [Inquilinus limosus]